MVFAKSQGCRNGHRPECAVSISRDHPGDGHRIDQHCAQRPVWLMSQPRTLRQQGKHLYWNGALSLVYGPERIEDNWWREAVSRDYYIARDPQGQQYWVFRDRLQDHWYIQGVFT